MDEPTSALDPISTSKIEDLAAELKSKYTIIMVTHNMQQAVRISDKTAFFLLGEVVEYGKVRSTVFRRKIKEQKNYITGRFGCMRNRFDRQLEQLNIEMIEMGALCEDMIHLAGKLVDTKSKEMISRINDLEEEINQKERDIERRCMKLLLQQQPVAGDLRVISAALKMVSDMERIGDQAVDIAGIVKKSDVVTVMNHHTHVLMMAARTLAMSQKLWILL